VIALPLGWRYFLRICKVKVLQITTIEVSAKYIVSSADGRAYSFDNFNWLPEAKLFLA
jgi:hypothetical protein